jgi:hypothetical protein
VAALTLINPDVMIFLFGTFMVGEALSESGVFVRASDEIFRDSKNLL